MTLKASLVFVREIGKFSLNFVTPAAFYSRRPAEIRHSTAVSAAGLIVRIVALDAVVEALPGGCLLSAVAAFGDVLGHFLMTCHALFGLKKIF